MICFEEFKTDCPARDWYEKPRTGQEGDWCSLYSDNRKCCLENCPTYHAITVRREED